MLCTTLYPNIQVLKDINTMLGFHDLKNTMKQTLNSYEFEIFYFYFVGFLSTL